MTKTELLEKFKKLIKKTNNFPRNIQTEDERREWLDKIYEQITNVAVMARKKGATDKEINEIYDKNTIFIKQDNLIDGIEDSLQDDLSIIDKPNL
jgi:hypothetical protein